MSTKLGRVIITSSFPHFSKSQFSKARPKVINYKNFDKNNFLNDLNSINVRLNKENPNQCYNLSTNSFLEVYELSGSDSFTS